jgi:hypothetical protein
MMKLRPVLPFRLTLGLPLSCLLVTTPTLGVAMSVDPFAEPVFAEESTNQAKDTMSNLTASFDFIYQGTYIPRLRHIDDNNVVEQVTTIDSSIKFDMSADTFFKGRVMADYLNKHSIAGTEDDVSGNALEFYVEHAMLNDSQFISLGRKNLGWSSGFQWRPADVIDNGFTTKNFDTLDPKRYAGIDQIQYEMISDVFDLSMVAASTQDEFFNGKQYAGKLTLKSVIDMGLIIGKHGDYSDKTGVFFDGNLPLATTFVVEAVKVKVKPAYLTSPFYFGQTLESLSGRADYVDVFAGVTHYIDDQRRLSLEFFHNGRGFATGMQTPTIHAAVANFIQMNSRAVVINPAIFSEQYLGRNYMYMAYTGYNDRVALQIKPSILLNMDDDSYIAALTLKKEISGQAEVMLKASYFKGSRYSDFGSIAPGASVGASILIHAF